MINIVHLHREGMSSAFWDFT